MMVSMIAVAPMAIILLSDCQFTFFAILQVRAKVCLSDMTQGGALLHIMRHSPHHLISGRGQTRTKVPHATVEGTGLQGDGTHLMCGVLQPWRRDGHTSTLDRSVPFVGFNLVSIIPS
jgi:hypothetical protein